MAMTYAKLVAYSPNKTVTNKRNIFYIVIHTMEAPEKPETAENVAIGWFGKTIARASAHWCFDSDSRVRCVDDKDVAWAAPGANSTGLQYELAGYASQNATGWNDEYSKALLDNAAQQAAQDAVKYGIPIKHLTTAEIKAGKKGFIGHIDATNAFNGGRGHTDPGHNFPWARFLDLVRTYAGQKATTKPVSIATKPVTLALGSKGARVTTLQKTLNDKWLRPNKWKLLSVDGDYGNETVRVIKAFQKSKGLTVDGVSGELTQKKIEQLWKVKI